MTNKELEKQLSAANDLINQQRDELDDLGNRNDQSLERIEQLTKEKADITTFRLLTLISKHKI